jgi:hypothetical protein
MSDKPIWSAPSPNFGDIHHARQDVPHASGHVCKFTTFETFLEPGSIDPAWMFTAATCIRTCPNGYIQRLLDNSRSFYSAKKELCAAWPPATPTCLASVPGDNTDHSRIDVPQASIFYCSPSGLSELLPARRISSVDNRLMAITELRHHICRGKAFVILN